MTDTSSSHQGVDERHCIPPDKMFGGMHPPRRWHPGSDITTFALLMLCFHYNVYWMNKRDLWFYTSLCTCNSRVCVAVSSSFTRLSLTLLMSWLVDSTRDVYFYLIEPYSTTHSLTLSSSSRRCNVRGRGAMKYDLRRLHAQLVLWVVHADALLRH